MARICRCGISECEAGIGADKISQRCPVDQVGRNLDMAVQPGRQFEVKDQSVCLERHGVSQDELQIKRVAGDDADAAGSRKVSTRIHRVCLYGVGASN